MAEKKDEACAVPAFIARATNFQASTKIDNEGVIRQRHDSGTLRATTHLRSGVPFVFLAPTKTKETPDRRLGHDNKPVKSAGSCIDLDQ